MKTTNPGAILLDTGVFIAADRGNFNLRHFLAQYPQAHFAMSAITAAELLEGVERSTGPHRRKREAVVEEFLGIFAAIDFTVPVARRWAKLAAHLAKRGEPIGAHDLQIAATALHHGMAVATFNLKHFQRVPGLAVMTPSPSTN